MLKSYISYYLKLWSLGKTLNLIKNVSSFYLSKFTHGYFIWGKPFTFFIEPTNLCNLHCFECPVGLKLLKRPQGVMRFEDYKKIIDNISAHAWYILLYFQGEPAINPDLVNMVNYAYQKKIYTVISTNGTRLANKKFCREIAESQLGELIISLDGATEETYKIYRQGGLFRRVIKGIRLLTETRRRLNKKLPRIVIQFLVMRHNEHEMEAIKKLGKELDVDSVIFKSPQIYDFESAEDILPQNPQFRRYKKVNGEYILKGTYSGYCRKIWIGSVITQDGVVIPCCFDKDANYPLGSVPSKDFEHIWKSEGYHKFRKKVVANRHKIPICQNCSEGLKTFFK